MKVVLLLMLAVSAHALDSAVSENNRQKRLLFFDEGGALVKTYSNPYMNHISENGQNLPFYGNFLNPFFNFIRHFGNSLIAYTIPVSAAIIQAIKLDPNVQNTLVVIPKQDPVVAPNTLCDGKRTQIPSPNVCNNFLNCWDGWAFEQECPTGLLFSSFGYCDYADNVDCRNRKVEPEKLQPQPQPACNKDFEAFRSTSNCNEFFVCVNRQPVKFQCPSDLAYSQILGVCDYADRVDCSSTGSPIVPSQPAYPTPAPAPIAPPSSSDTPAIPQEIPNIPPSASPAFPIPSAPEPSIPSPQIPSSPAIPEIPASPISNSPSSPPSLIPASPQFPSLPDSIPSLPIQPPFPISPPSSPNSPPSSAILPPSFPISPPSSPNSPIFPSLPPTIPPAPASIPPFPSLLPPGSVFPSIPPVYPAQRPVPPVDVFPAQVPDGVQKPAARPIKFSDFFTPACSTSNVAMSRQEAIHMLQKAISTNISF